MPPNGKQKDRCHACGRRSRENPPPNANPQARRQESLHASQEREPLAWSHAHRSPVSRATVSSWIKKRSSASSLTCNPARPGSRGSHFHDPGTGRTDGSFVLKKAHDSWIWIALCRKTRQVVAYATSRSEPARRVNACGRPFQQPTARDIAKRPFGRHTRR